MNENENEVKAMLTVTPGTPEETEAMRAMRESYEAQLAARDREMAEARAEHAKQIREILMTGKAPAPASDDADEKEETDEEHTARVAREIANKILKR